MTIGEKIIHLRNSMGYSQEKLASLLSVSRQSISKWESDETLPSVDKVFELSKLFNLSTDQLINDDIVINRIKKNKNDTTRKTKYFGTDGFRGEVNVVLNSDHAYKIGRFLGWYFSNPKYNMKKPGYRPSVVIGKDTRRSSYMLEYSVAAGLAASGADVSLMHVTTTPSVSYAVRMDNFDCGIMITASHNPFYDNGIKVINAYGEKLEDDVALLIEDYIDGNLKSFGIDGSDLPFAQKENIGCISDYSSGRNRYIGYLISIAKFSLNGKRIGLDCANGASFMIAKAVFDALGSQTYVINNYPNGTNINLNAGSTHIEHLVEFVRQNHLDVAFAYDGDADRCLAVDENGEVVDGDKIMYLLAKKLKREDLLPNNTLVATIMSNSGLIKALKKEGIKTIRTKVGDRFVYEKMLDENYGLGGEQSGHIIVKKYATTGDGILTSILVLEEMMDQKMPLSQLVKEVKLLPQILKNVRVTSKEECMNDSVVRMKFDEINSEIGDNGRALLRSSGTEPVVRIMIEYDDIHKCEEYIDRIYQVIKERGYVCE